MTYARARLWLGISGVGFFVTLSATALYYDLPRRLLSTRSSVTAILLTLALYIALSFPFDILGGHILPRKYHRTTAALPTFLRAWLQGILVQAFIMALCALVLLQAAIHGGFVLCFLSLIVLMLCLLAGQLTVATLVGALSSSKAVVPGEQIKQRTRVIQSTDPGFVGGIVGLPGLETIVFPATWLETLPKDIVTMQITRRAGALVTGARTRGVALALIWNLVGFTLATQMPRASITTPTGLIDAGLWFTLWSFVGLLLLPTLNRPGVLQADHYALTQGIPTTTLQQGITLLDQLQDDEPSRTRWVERVFHPIPSVESRMAALSRQSTHLGAWQGARVTLYLSWATFGFLSRAVHCNVGRPELWVLFPGD